MPYAIETTTLLSDVGAGVPETVMSDDRRKDRPSVADPDADASIWAEFHGEIHEEEGYHQGPQLIHPHVAASAAWSPYAYAAVLNQLLDEGLKSLTASASRLLLHLVRETLGRGKERLSKSLEELRGMTGLQKSTLIRAIDELSGKQVLIVKPGTSHVPATYAIDISKLFKFKLSDDTPLPTRFSIEYRLTELSDDDRAQLLAVERGLTPAMRKDVAMKVRLEFLGLGQTRPDPEQFKQACRYEILLREFAPARLRKAYPHWYIPFPEE